MRLFFYSLASICLVSILFTSIQADPAPVTKVIDLQSAQELQDILQKRTLTIVYFYASWCGPCKQLKPIYHDMSLNHPDITFVMVDGDKFVALRKEYGVEAYPWLLFFDREGKLVYSHRGSMTEGTLLDYVKDLKAGKLTDKQGPVVTSLEEPPTPPTPQLLARPQTLDTTKKGRATFRNQKSPRRSRRSERRQKRQEIQTPVELEQYDTIYGYM